MRILIGKALKHLYMLWESLILCKHGHILLSLTFQENTISNSFLYTHYTNTYQQLSLLQT